MKTIEQAIENERKEILNKVKKWFEFPENPKGKKFECDYSDIEELLEQLESPQNCKGGQTISDNVGSWKNSLQGEVSAPSETSAYGLQATSERSDYKTGSNMETTGDVRLKSQQVVSLISDGTSRSSKSSVDISLEQLKKEKEECDNDVKRYQKLAKSLGWKGNKSIWNVLSPSLLFYYAENRGKSLALSKGIELAEKQKKMFEELIDNINALILLDNSENAKYLVKEIKALAEQLEVKDE